MREFTGAFFGTLVAIFVVVAVLSWFMWRELDSATKRAVERRAAPPEKLPDAPEAAQQAAVDMNSRQPLRVVPSASDSSQ